MPSPVAHALAGCVVYHAWPYLTRRHDHVVFASCAALAVLPDIDFLPGVLSGEPWRFHPSVTHTFVFSLVAGLGVAIMLRSLGRLERGLGIVLIAACASHVLLDLFNVDDREPIGMQLLWPLSDVRFLSPQSLFPGLQTELGGSGGTWLLSIVGVHNWRVMAQEAGSIFPFLLGARVLTQRRIAAPDLVATPSHSSP